MTEAEAVERILKGGPFKGCMHCDGMGTTPTSREHYKRAVNEHHLQPPGTPEPKAKDYTQLCMRCKGVGLANEETYVEACQVLGRPVPAPQLDYPTVIKRAQGEILENFKQHVQDLFVYGNAFIPIDAPKDPHDDR